MSQDFVTEIKTQMLRSIDPNAGLERDAVQSFVQNQKVSTLVSKAHATGDIGQLLQMAVEDKAPTAVIQAYEKILSELVK